MCGIAGFFDKTDIGRVPAGATLLRMLTALSCRGPDSAGIALWGPGDDGLIVRVKLGDGGDLEARRREVLRRARRATRVQASAMQGALLRLLVAKAEPAELAAAIESVAPDVEVVSMGHRLEIVKQVGSPGGLDAEYAVSAWTGTHGIGHTRLSTESRVDLSHSQPFWAHGVPDLAMVHNGHITNYHKLRRRYEQRGVRFYTENDSEIIGVYLARAAGRRPHAGRGAPGARIARPRRLVQLPGGDRRRARLREGPLRLQAADRRGDARASSPSPPRRSRSRPRSGAATGPARPGRAPPGCGSSRAGRRGSACGASAGSREMAAIDCAPPLSPRDQPVHPAR